MIRAGLSGLVAAVFAVRGRILTVVYGVLALGLAASHPLAPALAVSMVWGVVALHLAAPRAWLFLIPMGLPVLSFAPWTARVWVDEFDLLVLACLAGSGMAHWLVEQGRHQDPKCHALSRVEVPAMALTAVVALGALRGFLGPWPAQLDWTHGGYDNAVNALRVSKALLWVLALVPALKRAFSVAPSPTSTIVLAHALGLMLTCMFVLLERWQFPGLFEFTAWYRITGLFWEMHVGGAAIDGYLAMTIPLVWSLLALSRGATKRSLALLAGAVIVYVVVVTYSRSLMIALGVAFVVHLSTNVALRWRARLLGTLGVATAVLALANWTSLEFLAQRWKLAERDAEARMQHWRSALAVPRHAAQWWLGVGAGRLPVDRAVNEPETRWPGRIQWVGGKGQPFVRLQGTSGQVDRHGLFGLTQRLGVVSVPGPFTVTAELRGPPKARLHVRLCEQHLLYSGACQFATIQMESAGGDDGETQTWQVVTRVLRGPPLNQTPGRADRGLMLWVWSGSGASAIDLRQLRLAPAWGSEMTRNGDFHEGLVYWLPSAQHQFGPWHVDNHFLEWLVERGILGLALWIVLNLWALWRIRSRPFACQASTTALDSGLRSALVAGLVLGLFCSIQDVPRVAFLNAWIVAIALLRPPSPHAKCDVVPTPDARTRT